MKKVYTPNERCIPNLAYSGVIFTPHTIRVSVPHVAIYNMHVFAASKRKAGSLKVQFFQRRLTLFLAPRVLFFYAPCHSVSLGPTPFLEAELEEGGWAPDYRSVYRAVYTERVIHQPRPVWSLPLTHDALLHYYYVGLINS